MKEKYNEDPRELGLLYHSESIKASKKALFFGFILLLAHLVDIKPKEYHLLGLGIDITDERVFYGFFAAIVLYQGFQALLYGVQGVTVIHFDLDKSLNKKLDAFFRTENPYASSQKIERAVFWTKTFFWAIILPFVFIMFILALVIAYLAFADFFGLVSMIIENKAPWLIEGFKRDFGIGE